MLEFFSKMEMERKLIVVPIMIAFFILLFGFLIIGNEIGVLGNLVLICAFLIVGPYSVYKYMEWSWIKSLEEKFPVFLRDLSEAKRSGLNLLTSFSTLSKLDYGRLTPEIKRISNQLTWGVSFEKAIDIFTKRVRKSDLISRSLRIIKESYISGGSIEKTLESISLDVGNIKELENEKKSTMGQHVVMMYALHIMFLAIAVMLTKTLVPVFEEQSIQSVASGIGFFSPCVLCANSQDITCAPCSVYDVIGHMFGFKPGVATYYSALFFSMLMLQGFFNGLLSGQISQDSVVAGLKHSLIMVASGFMLFSLLSAVNFFG